MWPIIYSILVPFGQIRNFRDLNLLTFYFDELTHCLDWTLKEHLTFHLQHKHSGTFANRKYEEPSYPKKPKMCDPILVTLLKMRPRYIQSGRENATQSSGTSPLASYKVVPPGDICHFDLWKDQKGLTGALYGFDFLFLWSIPITKTLLLQQSEGIQSSKLGMWKGYHFSVEAMQKKE